MQTNTMPLLMEAEFAKMVLKFAGSPEEPGGPTLFAYALCEKGTIVLF